jgi:5-methylcytosine-specific restriction endonuclease McrA
MHIFTRAKEQSLNEKKWTAKLLETLLIIDRDKLYVELKYNSLHKYIVKELKYSDAEAALRVSAVKLMAMSKLAVVKMHEGSLTLTNAALASRILKNEKNEEVISKVIETACEKSSRAFEEFAEEKFQHFRREIIVLEDERLKKFDRLRKIYGDLSNSEILDILLEEKLKSPDTPLRGRKNIAKNSRYIPVAVRAQVNKGICENCGSRRHLEYDHKQKFSHGGLNDHKNIGVLCRSCNQRKEINARQMNVFV